MQEMATSSNIPSWKIPVTEEPGGLQSKGPQRVKHNREQGKNSSRTCGFSFIEQNPKWLSENAYKAGQEE